MYINFKISKKPNKIMFVGLIDCVVEYIKSKLYRRPILM